MEIRRRVCSSDSSCVHYGDCCFDADVASNDASRKNTSCVSLLDHKSVLRKIVMVTRCNDSWPEDEVRKGCEDAGARNETFHRIPATSGSGYTYSNGFCALCNYDSKSWVFWTVSSVESKRATFDLQVDSLKRNLRYCTASANYSDTCGRVNGSEFIEAESKCKLYLEPVRQNYTGKTYKNVYCALCDEVNITSLVCYPVEGGSIADNVDPPDGSSAFRGITVKRLTINATSCAAWFDGKCYINDTTYRYKGNAFASNTTGDESYTYTYQHYLIMICIGLSLFFLIMKGITYAVFSAARNFASRCNLCLSATLFFTQLVYILAGYLDVPPDVCVASSVIQHFGFVATFAWTTVLSFDMWRNISSMRVTTRSDQTLIFYGTVAWGVPFLFVAACCGLNWGAPWSPYSPAYGQYYCFFGKYRPYVAFFLVPMGVLLAVDMGLYAHIVIYVRRTKDFRKGMVSNKDQPSDMALFFKLALIMGASWFLGLLNFINSSVIQVLTSILNGLQGVYLFFGFQDYKYYVDALKARNNKDKRTLSSSASNCSNTTEVHSVSDLPAASDDPERQRGVKLPMENISRAK
ncbi:G-protein coupled receptor Mth2 [Rhipicephalus sanguineus]|nr:G-protein coupled receptor Mth2 [Rhipicephalus sanguineus]